MHRTKHPKTEDRLTAARTATDLAEQQRRLGQVYRLILSYEPRKRAVARGEISEAARQMDNAQSTAG